MYGFLDEYCLLFPDRHDPHNWLQIRHWHSSCHFLEIISNTLSHYKDRLQLIGSKDELAELNGQLYICGYPHKISKLTNWDAHPFTAPERLYILVHKDNLATDMFSNDQLRALRTLDRELVYEHL